MIQMNNLLLTLFLGLLLISCSDSSVEKKGFQVNEISEDEKGQKVVGLKIDSLNLETKPRNILLTKHPAHRLTPIYKVNYHKKTKEPFTGSTDFHGSTRYSYRAGSNWNDNFMPGFSAVYGYNLVNISHNNNITNKQNKLFDKPVLIKTCYYPAFSNDTLNTKAVNRDYYMVSVYDEDTNKDGFVTVNDLRKLYYFDMEGMQKRNLVPANYSVMSSEYDSANDYMYVFARLDENENGEMEYSEPTDIFWIDLVNPSKIGFHYKSE